MKYRQLGYQHDADHPGGAAIEETLSVLADLVSDDG